MIRVIPARLVRALGHQGCICRTVPAQCPHVASATVIPLEVPSSATPRAFSSAAGNNVAKVLRAELKHEGEQYQQAKEIQTFLNKGSWKLVEAEGDVNIMLQKEVEERVVQIEWQLTSPFDPTAEDDVEPQQEATDFTVIIQNKAGNAGISFFCSTQSGEDHRYVIGNVKSFSTLEEKDSPSAYNGPEFEDVEEKLQEALDEYLAEMGVNHALCDFIDAMALDKEQREYIGWLKHALKFMES